jgi:hypothetical protein
MYVVRMVEPMLVVRVVVVSSTEASLLLWLSLWRRMIPRAADAAADDDDDDHVHHSPSSMRRHCVGVERFSFVSLLSIDTDFLMLLLCRWNSFHFLFLQHI